MGHLSTKGAAQERLINSTSIKEVIAYSVIS